MQEETFWHWFARIAKGIMRGVLAIFVFLAYGMLGSGFMANAMLLWIFLPAWVGAHMLLAGVLWFTVSFVELLGFAYLMYRHREEV